MSRADSPSQTRSRYYSRGGGGYGSGMRDGVYDQGSGSPEYRRSSRSPGPQYGRPMERDRSRDRGRDRYSERERSRYRPRSPSRSPGGGYPNDGYRSSRGSMPQRFMPEPSRVLGVFGLNMRTTERDLKKLFSAYGEVDKVVIIYHHATQQSRRFGFISFKALDSAGIARKKVNGMEFHGRKIRVDYSVTQRAHSPTPGRYMGRERSKRRTYRSGYDYPRDDFGSTRHPRYDRRDREDDRDHERSLDSHDKSYNDRPPVGSPRDDNKWEEKKDSYPVREPPRSAGSSGNGWQHAEEPESYQ